MSAHRFWSPVPIRIGVNLSHNRAIAFQRTPTRLDSIDRPIECLHPHGVFLVLIKYQHVTRSFPDGYCLCSPITSCPTSGQYRGFPGMMSLERGCSGCPDLPLTGRARSLALHSLAVGFFRRDALYEFLLGQSRIRI